MTIFKACDVRGVVGQQWDVGEAQRIGAALGQMLRERHQTTIVVGGDFRRSTPRLKEALTQGLSQGGITVQDVGQVPTPVVQFAARHMQCPNLAIVTASHNPGRYNGIKFVLDGQPPVPALINELAARCDAPMQESASSAERQECSILSEYEDWVGKASYAFVKQHLEGQGRAVTSAPQTSNAVTSHLVSTLGNVHRQRVVVDTMGGAFTSIAPRLLTAAGYEVISLDDQLDPEFARRDPNPATDANMQPVVAAVLQRQADVGLALDGDGDRVIFVDAHGTIARPEQIAAILMCHCMGACSIVCDLKCASIVARTAHDLGGSAIMQPSGHGFIKRKLLELSAELGVEVSGHHFFGALEGGDDGLFTALVVLQLLDATGGRLADWLAEIGWPVITADLRVPFAGDASVVLDRIASHCGGNVLRMDGVRAEYEDSAWALARASITEPAITFRFEGDSMQHVRAIATRFLATEPDLCQQVMERIA